MESPALLHVARGASIGVERVGETLGALPGLDNTNIRGREHITGCRVRIHSIALTLGSVTLAFSAFSSSEGGLLSGRS